MNTRLKTRITLIAVLLITMLGSNSVCSQTMEVMSISPPEANQGTVNLDVVITGDGFEEGSQAVFFVAGTPNPGGIIVNHVQFRDSNTLVANLDIDECAVVGNFDVVVLTTSGRRGKGNTLMSVHAPDSGRNPDCQDATADFKGDFGAMLEGSYLGDLANSNFEDMAGKLTGNETVTLKGDAAVSLAFLDAQCRLSEVESQLCSRNSSGKGILPLGVRLIAVSCEQVSEVPCRAIVFDAATGLEWNIHHEQDEYAAHRVQLQLKWNNENGEQHYLRIAWAVKNDNLTYADFGDLLSLENPASLHAGTVEFVADPFRIEGDLLYGSGKKTKSFVYMDYGEGGAVTFSIETSAP